MTDFTINTNITKSPIAEIVVNPVLQRNEPCDTSVHGLSPEEKAAPEVQKSIYGEIPQTPTQKAVEGISFDFNHGIRILFPHNGKTYHVTFADIDTGIILYSADTVPGAYVTSVKKFYIRFIRQKAMTSEAVWVLPLCRLLWIKFRSFRKRVKEQRWNSLKFLVINSD